ncbi:MAG: caspase family protein [Bacteroidetes bacterium]|nr:caspase family protein [Bacteroidota bacterium]
MKKVLLSLVLLSLVCCQTLFAVTIPNQRALVIGIDRYNPDSIQGRWHNLDGCKNDAISVRALLIARYNFPASSIDTLYNQQASRASILKSFNRLLDKSNPGDIAVIYYAGHGSQVKNSKSAEEDKMDESMVPADSYKGEKDIRDKELAIMFNKFADKGVLLTILYDCCHSGSIGRGNPTEKPPKYRNQEPDLSYDANDPTTCTPPEDKGVLIMSASQDFEFASEQRDENHIPHGAFTIALIQSLSSLPVSSSANDIFSSVRSILKYNGKLQEPVLAGTPERKKETIFGIEKGALSGKTLIAVLGLDKESVQLQGGIVLGINVNSELINKAITPNIKLKVVKIEGLNKCRAIVTKGKLTDIKPGNLFELSNWCTPAGAVLKVYIPPTDLSYDQIKNLAEGFSKLGNDKEYSWVTDPAKDAPTHSVFFSNGKWYIGLPDGKVVDLGPNPDIKIIRKSLTAGSKLYVSLPPPKELVQLLKERYKYDNAVEPVTNASDAQYFLTGRYMNGKLEYAYSVPQVSVKDSSFANTMPIRTNYFTFDNNETSIKINADSLAEYSLRLAKIKAWLVLSGPPDEGSFPFHLGIKNAKTKKIISNNSDVRLGDTLGFVLVTDINNLNQWDRSRKYIYVFSIDSKGKMTLYFPRKGSSVENKMPSLDQNGQPFNESNIGRFPSFIITEPLGLDTYIMIASDEPIPNPDVLNQEGVLSRGDRGPGNGGLQSLLNVGTRSRGEMITPSDWGIQKIVLKSISK